MIDPFFASVIDGEVYAKTPNLAILQAAMAITKANLFHLVKTPGIAEINALGYARDLELISDALVTRLGSEELTKLLSGGLGSTQDALDTATQAAVERLCK